MQDFPGPMFSMQITNRLQILTIPPFLLVFFLFIYLFIVFFFLPSLLSTCLVTRRYQEVPLLYNFSFEW